MATRGTRIGLIIAFLAVVLVLAGALWWLPGRPGTVSSTPAAAPLRPAAGLAFAQPETPSRRVAGRVTLDGRAAAGVRVVLASLGDAAAGTSPQQRVTSRDGGFDFGPQPAQRYVIEASRAGATAARLALDVRDPATDPERLELRLGPCEAVVHGVVRDASGGVIAGARVGHAAAWLSGLGVSTDPSGAYELCVRPGEVALVVTADGYGAVTFLQAVTARVRRDVVLAPEAIVEGVVVRRHDNTPVPGAIVELRPSEVVGERPAPALATADEAGRFHVAGLAAGRWLASASATGWTSSGPTAVGAEAATTAPPIVLRLDGCARVSGRVTEGTRAVRSAEVRAVLRDTGQPTLEAVTRGDGGFVLACVPHGTVTFEVIAHDVRAPDAVAIAGASAEFAIEVESRATIHGRVIEDGAPVADAIVDYEGGNRRSIPVTSDGDGRFVIAGLGAGSYQVWATAGTRRSPRRAVKLAPRQAAEVELSVAATAQIRGTVVDQSDNPVDDARVTFTRADGGDRGTAVTLADGSFEVTHLAGHGAYQASVALATGRRPLPPAAASHPVVDLTATSRRDDVRLAVRLERDAIAGTVVDVAGEPIADATVVAAADGGAPAFRTWMPIPRTLTGGDGRFELDGLAAGAYALRASSAHGGQATEAGVATGRRDVRLVLSAPGSIEGRIEGFTSVPDVFAQVADGTAETFVRGFLEGNRFEIRGLAPTRYTITAQSRSEGASAIVDVVPGRAATIVLRSAGSAALAGRVVDHRTRAPLPGRRCRVFMVSGGGWHGMTRLRPEASAESDADGRFTIDPVPAGEVHVQCFGDPSRYSLSGATLVIAPGARAMVELEAVPIAAQIADLGASMMPRRTGAVLAEVVPGGSADTAGLRAGDVIVAVDGLRVVGMVPNAVSMLVRSREPGSRLRVTVSRGDREVTVELTLGAVEP
jgi:hypothetical protein